MPEPPPRLPTDLDLQTESSGDELLRICLLVTARGASPPAQVALAVEQPKRRIPWLRTIGSN